MNNRNMKLDDHQEEFKNSRYRLRTEPQRYLHRCPIPSLVLLRQELTITTLDFQSRQPKSE